MSPFIALGDIAYWVQCAKYLIDFINIEYLR